MLVTLRSEETPSQRVRRLRRSGMTEQDAVTNTALHFGIAVQDEDAKVILWRLADVSRLLWMQWMVATARISDGADCETDEPLSLPSTEPKVWSRHPWRTLRP